MQQPRDGYAYADARNGCAHRLRGIQEETTYLGVPCLTLRSNTERPITVTMGTNILVGEDKSKLTSELQNILTGKAKKGTAPSLWDGHAGDRIADILAALA